MRPRRSLPGDSHPESVSRLERALKRIALAAEKRNQLASVSPPEGPVFRVGRGLNPFEPPPWKYVGVNRFDDPRYSEEQEAPGDNCFRTIYASTQRAGAFGETIASLRPSIELLAELREVDDDESLDTELFHGRVPEDWRRPRSLGLLKLDRALRFVDVDDPQTLARLRIDLAPTVRHLGLEDLDLSAIMGSNRPLTQEVARFVHERTDTDGLALYSGIRYVSRLNLGWECWALFVDRLEGHCEHPVVETIFSDDPGLLEAAAYLGLSIETARK